MRHADVSTVAAQPLPVRHNWRDGVMYVAAAARERAWSRDRLLRIGADAHVATNLTDALQQLRTRTFVLCLIDLADDRAALSVARVIRAQYPGLPIIGIIDPAHPLMAGEALIAGVVNLLPWPFDERDVALMLADASEQAAVAADPLDAELGGRLIAQSPVMRQVVERVEAVGRLGRGLLICGEPATGRETVARAVHEVERGAAGGPFIAVDCSNRGAAEFERSLFGAGGSADDGHAAIRVTPDSLLLKAQHGTFFLRRVVDLPARVQMRLARVMRDGEVTVRGESAELDVKIVASVEPDVLDAVADGRLRKDFFDRLAQDRIDVPPLRRRREDMPQLVVHLLREVSAALGRRHTLSRAALALASALPWPGNVRELAAVLERAASDGPPVIQLQGLLVHVELAGRGASVEDRLTLKEARGRFERDWIAAELIRCHGRVGEAAKALGIQRTNLYRKVRQLDIARGLVGGRR